MPVSNRQIADIFDELADLLEIQGYNPYKIRAYKNAALKIRNLSENLSDLVIKNVDISKIPTIGERIAKKIVEIVKTQKLAKLENLKKLFPPHLLDVLKIEGIGPKRAKILYDKLQIGSLQELRDAALSHKIRELSGFDKKIEDRIIDKVILAKKIKKRFMYSVAEPNANDIIDYIQKSNSVIKVMMAGSFRRRKDTVGDLDIVATSKNPSKLIDYFVKYPYIKEVILHGDTRSTIILKDEIQVDFRCVKPDSFGSVLHYFTGSRSHVLAIRNIALKRGLKINEYGIFKDEKKIAGLSENDVYKEMGFAYIEPELRENRGELDAAKEGKLPTLVQENDLQGDLHIRTNYGDGKKNITQIAKIAKSMGYKYIAIAEHSKSNGLDEKKLEKQMLEIDRVNELVKDITILKSIEVNILKNGSLDMPVSLLKEFDFVTAGIHSGFDLSQSEQTKRVLKALESPYLDILAHPMCRLIGERESIKIDIDEIFKAVNQKRCFLEINSQPKRLDLNDIYTKLAKDMGVKLVISSDGDDAISLGFIKYGIYQARRGWLEKKDVINSLSLSDFTKLIKSRRDDI